jgi:hypothetical protein
LVFLLGPFPLGQETSPLPDAPQPTQSQSPQPNPEQNGPQHEPSKNHIFWVIPNYRSDENPATIKPLTAGAKMKVAFDDSFDPSAFLVAGVFAGLGMAQRQYASFGQGAQGFGKYYGGAFADQDPRYFVRGKGGFWKRTGCAMSREFITRGDHGRTGAPTSTRQSWRAMLSPRAFPTSTTLLPTDQWGIRQISAGNRSL